MTDGPIRYPPHPANVPGPFYVEDGCCLACAVWTQDAADLLAWTEDDSQYGKIPHCYVARQPETEAEFEQIMKAMEYAEADCFRVHACRPEWMQRLREAGLGHNIDPPEGPARERPF